MITREITPELIQVASEYPVVTLTGPRQSGKTTLAKLTFPAYKYCSMEDPALKAYASSDPRAFLKEYDSHVIIDEVQRVPLLLSYIQTLVDADPNSTKGRFILTGSHQLELRAEVSQSLAGRTALLTLLPLSISEVETIEKEMDRDDFLFKGFFPRVYQDKINPSRAYANYYRTYVERDVRQLINLKDASLFEKFIKLMAGRVGQILNLNSLANDVGVSSTTLKKWLSILEVSFILYKLSPFYENFGKRVIKSPKYYFTDVGLLCFLLGIQDKKQISRDPLIGNIFENLVVIESLKSQYNQGKTDALYFFRDNNGNEVDIVFQDGRKLIPIEIKSSSTFSTHFIKGIEKFQKTAKEAKKGCIIYSGDFTPETDTYKVLNFKDTKSVFVPA
ncbi:MAG: ATP-binding protein [Cyclobacteriaceae bacterium]